MCERLKWRKCMKWMEWTELSWIEMTCIDILNHFNCCSYSILLSRVHLITVDCSNLLQWRAILHDVRFFNVAISHGCANPSVFSSVELQCHVESMGFEAPNFMKYPSIRHCFSKLTTHGTTVCGNVRWTHTKKWF